MNVLSGNEDLGTLVSAGPAAAPVEEFDAAQYPYPGLRAFQMNEDLIFFGRKEHRDDLLDLVEKRRFLGIVGPSGCGKSSLIRAGVIPALHAGLLTGAGSCWHVAVMRPGNQPISNLAAALRGSGGFNGHSVIQDDGFLPTVLRRGPLGLVDALGEYQFDRDSSLLLLVDQFEELFRFNRQSDGKEAQAFVELLLASAKSEKFPVTVIITMRSDFLGDCPIFRGLPEMLNGSQYLTPRLNREQQRLAIEGPAVLFNTVVRPELVNRILNEMGSDPDQLPLMQHLLMRMWRKERQRAPDAQAPIELTLDTYKEVGGLSGCVSGHAEAIYRSLAPAEQRMAELMLRCLTEVALDAKLVRREREFGELCKELAIGADVPERTVLRKVLDELRREGRCFLMPPIRESIDDKTPIDVSHESVIRQWGTLKAWALDENRLSRVRKKVSEKAADWSRNPSDRAYLLTGVDLAEAKAWRDQYPTQLGDDEKALLKASIEHEQEGVRRDEAAKSAEKLERRNRWLTALVAMSVAGMIVTISLTFWAFTLTHKVAEHLKEAQDFGILATKRLQEKDAQEVIARTQTKLAEDAAKRANISGFLTNLVESTQSETPLKGLLASIEALELSDDAARNQVSSTADSTLRKALGNIGGRGFYANQGSIYRLATHEDQAGALRWLATAGQDGSLVLWKMADDGAATPIPLTFGFQTPITWLTISDSGRWLIARSGADHLFSLWDLKTPNQTCTVVRSYGSVYSSSSGDWLLTYASAKPGTLIKFQAKLINLQTTPPAETEITCPDNVGTIRYLSFSKDKDKRWLALCTQDGDVFLCDLRAIRPGAELKAAKLQVPAKTKRPSAVNAEFTDAGDRLVVVLSDGTVRTWKEQNGSWQGPAKDEKLAPFGDDIPVKMMTDLRGLVILVGKKSLNDDDSSQALSPAKRLAPLPYALARPVVSVYDASRDDVLEFVTDLKGFDESMDWNPNKHFQIDSTRRWLAAKGRNKSDGVRIWDLQNANKLKEPISIVPPEGVQEFQLSSNGRWLVTSSATENLVRLWDLWSDSFASNPMLLRGHDGNVSAFMVSKDSHWLVTAGNDGTVRTWDLTAPSASAEPVVLRNPSSARQSMLLTPGHRWLARADSEGEVLLWDLRREDLTKQPHAVLKCSPKRQFAAMHVSDDGHWLATTCKNEPTILWDLNYPKPPRFCELQGIDGFVTRFVVSEKWVAANVSLGGASSFDAVKLWRLLPGTGVGVTRIAEVMELPGPNYAGPFLASGRGLLTYTYDKKQDAWTFTMWNITGEKPEPVPLPGKDKKGPGKTIGFATPDGQSLIVIPEFGKAMLYDLNALFDGRKKDPREVEGLNYQEHRVQRHRFSANNQWLEALTRGSGNSRLEASTGRIAFWALNTSDPIIRKKESVESSTLYAMSPDRRWFATKSKEGQTTLWDLNSSTTPISMKLQDNLAAAVFTGDSNWLVTADNRTIQVLDLNSPKKLPKTIKYALQSEIKSAAVNAKGGNWLALGESDGLIRVWDLAQGPDAKAFVLPNGPTQFQPSEMTMSTDGSRLMSVDASHTVFRLSRIPLDDVRKIADRTIGRNLSRAEWNLLRLPGAYRLTIPGLPEATPPVPPILTAVIPPAGTPRAKKLAELNVQDALTDDDPRDPGRMNFPCKYYSLPMAAGETYTIDMQSSDVDSFLRLEDAAGKEVAHDDDGGGFPNARIVYTAKQDGPYKIVATTFNGKTGAFQLTVRKKALAPVFGPFPKPSDANDLTAEDNEDTILLNCPSKVYTVALEKGKLYQFDMQSTDFDAYLRLEDAEGIRLSADDNGGGGFNARIVYNCPRAGVFRVVAVSRNGAPGSYRLSLRTQE